MGRFVDGTAMHTLTNTRPTDRYTYVQAYKTACLANEKIIFLFLLFLFFFCFLFLRPSGPLPSPQPRRGEGREE